jgi:hypothetical protein
MSIERKKKVIKKQKRSEEYGLTDDPFYRQSGV